MNKEVTGIDLLKPGVALLIDTWEENRFITDRCYKNIVDFIQNNNIESVVLANYGFNFFTHYNTSWMNSAHQMFYTGGSISMKEQWRMSVIDNSSISTESAWHTKNDNLVKDGGGKDTSDIILDMNFNGVKLLCHRLEDLDWYLNNVAPHIENIWYFGMAWDVCVRGRPVGYAKMSQHFPNKIHLTKQDCVVTSQFTYPSDQDMHDWILVEEDIWCLDQHKKNLI